MEKKKYLKYTDKVRRFSIENDFFLRYKLNIDMLVS